MRKWVSMFGVAALLAQGCGVLEEEEVNNSDAVMEIDDGRRISLYDGGANGTDGNEDGIANQGETLRMSFRTKNSGSEDAPNVTATISTSNVEVIALSKASQSLGTVAAYEGVSLPEANSASSVLFTLAPIISEGKTVKFTVRFEDSEGNSWNDEISVKVEPTATSIAVRDDYGMSFSDDGSNGTNGNGDEDINPGETIAMNFCVRNVGGSKAVATNLVVRCSDSCITLLQDTSFNAGNIDPSYSYTTPDASTASALLFAVDSGITPRTATLQVVATDKWNNQWTDNISLNIVSTAASVEIRDDYCFYLYDGTSNGTDGNGDDVINAGETVALSFYVKNVGASDAPGLTVMVSVDDQYVQMAGNSEQVIGDLAAYAQASTPDAETSTAAILFSVDAATPTNHTATFTATMKDRFGNIWTDQFTGTIR